ncbi:MAG: DUF4974 domain-containing protein [Prevotella sp.]|nr:DUF4974 domain-containing protein [Prevotella sp.]
MNKTELLFQMMEQPQLYTAEEWQEILSDEECREIYTLMAKTKSAFDSQKEIDDKTIDAEWKKLTLSSRRNWLRVAAMFIGILMLSGIALAAIHISRHVYGNHDAGELQSPTQETRISNSNQQTVEADSISTEPKLYDNVPLGEIFQDISNHYNVKVVYQNDDAPRLRLFYRWKPEYTLEKVVEMLNNFEWIQIQAENDTLFIKTTAIPAKDC